MYIPSMITDTALQHREADGRPIRVGMIGAGATGRAIALQLATPVPGIRLAAIANRTPAHSRAGLQRSGDGPMGRGRAPPARWKRVSRGGCPSSLRILRY